MTSMQDLKDHYGFTDDDEELLKAFQPLAAQHKERFSGEFHNYLYGLPETTAILNTSNRQRLLEMHSNWFMSLFGGAYDNNYLNHLTRIGHAHVKVGLNVHFVNVAMNRVRHFLLNLIDENYPDRDERRALREATEKILDMNLDVMSASYREEELKKVFVSRKLESHLIRLAERFTYGLNLVLVLALAGVSISVALLFGWDLINIFRGDVEKGILSALGELLILWMMIELMDNEIKNLKGGKFNILVFIGVIIVAMIREILISTLRHDDLATQAFLAGTLLILGILYYLVSRAQKDLDKA
ncbi:MULTISPECIES: protoglobin domain-containing protein [Oryzomonas]|uniref:Heme-binding sensor globin domain-containing protein n=2 Tax=Oryzomonas TaxID=2855184 RepID=A0A5A9XL41_9BACT|nr:MULTISPECIES: protoglobin domain-containing protein [Oryzomonas]KAA0893383.1 heme-binding sensor globin domain-containing protein [Oryzomonas rubra]KAB0672267.1 heme-binding sensor globin domain-containing protein [Oryzomonas sagensis]